MEHIIPVNDTQEHTFIKTGICKCGPTIDKEMNLAIHNAFDGREFFESNSEGIEIDKDTPKYVFFVSNRSH